MRLALASWCFLLGACDTPLSAGGEWEAVEDITGPLAPEMGRTFVLTDPTNLIRIGSFNVALAPSPSELAEWIREDPELNRVNVWMMQEIESHPGEEASRVSLLAEALQMNYVYAPARTEGQGTHGLAILSLFPLYEVEVMRLPKYDTSFRPRDRIALRAAIEDYRGTEVQLANIHLDLRMNISDRIEQAHAALRDLSDVSIVGGDFNTNPFAWIGPTPLIPNQATTGSDQAEIFDRYLRSLGFSTPTSELGPTQSTAGGDYRLDALFARQLEVRRVGKGPTSSLSDHMPIWLDFAIDDLSPGSP